MAELKHTFTSGRMNKDLDERLIPNGEYIDAVNIQISSSEGSDVGAIENLLGNEKLSSLRLKNAKTLGSIAYNLKDKIYWFVTSDEIDGIYEYDEKLKTISPILIDKKQTNNIDLDGIIIDSNIDNELILENVTTTKLSQLIGNDLPLEIDDEVLVKNNILLASQDPNIRITIPKNTVVKKDTNEKIVFKNIEYNGNKYGGVDIKSQYTSNGILNFSKNNLITGVNIIDDLLFWTDNLNQPRRINISNFKKYTNGIFDNDTEIEYAAKDPVSKQVSKLKRFFTEDDISVIKKAPMYAPSMQLYDSVTDGTVDIKYSLDLSDVYIGKIFTIESLVDFPSWKVGDFVTIQSEDADFVFDASVKSTDGSIIELSLSTITGEFDKQTYDCDILLKQKKPLYELNFVRFAYRWKYKNGEYSILSPFTEPAFIHGDFKYDGKEAFNYGMINKLQRVVLNQFDTGNDDISEIDILFKEGRNQNIYVLKTLKYLDFNNEYTITKEQIHSVIPNDQLLRAWDNVPKRAKSQEITANRVIYGNYTQNYDVYSEPDILVSTVARQDDLSRTIKSNRTYQIGVAYIDEYNRHTPVLSNDTGAFNITKDNSTLKNQFSISLNNKPPAWAKWFKYYIKDTSGEYYNLSADRFYQDTENGFTYVSFPSSDRSKITKDHYILLKKKHGADEAVLDADNRYKVIDIFADPPEFITNRKRTIYSLGDIVFTDDYSGSGGGTAITNRDQAGAQNGSPVEEYASFQMKKAGDGQDSGSGVPIADANELKPGRFIQFTFADKQSKTYEIKSVQQHPAGSNEVKVTVTEPFEDDVNIIYSKVAPYNLGNDGDNLGVGINILETYSAAGDKEFDGRFFVKLKTNGVLSDSIIKETVGGKSYLAKQAIRLNGVYPVSDRDGVKFLDKDRSKNTADKTPDNPFIVAFGGTAVPGNTESTGKRIDFGGNLPYNITLEAATHRSSGQFLPLARQIKAGDFVRFKNPDGTLHHDSIYEIGAVRIDQFNRKIPGTDYRKGWYRISIAFIDENGQFKPLDADVCTRDQNNTGKEPIMEILQELNEENIIIKDPAIFETEPLETKTELDIYYETEKAIPIEEHGQSHTLNWYNAICFGNGVESNRIRDDFNAIFIDTGVRASTVLAEPFKEEHKFNGLIWSGIINSRSSTNQSNQFNMANAITKDLLPSYGSIQKLFARDSDLVIYCEDKIVRALADKDILYNADGSANITASNKVIGNVIPFTGEYGISTHPESFAYYGFRAYNTDAKRGVVLRLSQDGLTPISAANMGGYFRQLLYGNTDLLIGSYDNRNKLYNLSHGFETICFSEDVNGWVTRKTFYPDNGISLNNRFYTYKSGELWAHDSLKSPRNNFYNEQSVSSVDLNINDNPSVIKKYKTLGYEGSAGWNATVETDQQLSSELSFKEKENKYFVNISGESKTIDNIDAKNISVQGIGRSVRKTTIPVSNGNVVVGLNGEIIIIGGGDGILGNDWIIWGNIGDISFNDDGDIVVNGDGINVGPGDGNTDGADNINDHIDSGGGSGGTGGGGVGDTGGNYDPGDLGGDTGGDVMGGGLDDYDGDLFNGDIIVNDDGGDTGDGFGDVDTDGSGDGIGDIDSEDDYTDQLGDISNTTYTFKLQTGVNFYSKDVDVIKKPGEQISQVVFTIYPDNGYIINTSTFSSQDNVVFSQDGDNIKATFNTNLIQPTSDDEYIVYITGTATKKPISISGSIQFSLQNAEINNEDINSYIVSGEYGQEKKIIERIITSESGYYLTKDSITVNNTSIYVEKIKLSDYSYKIIETVFIPKTTKINNDYTITVNAIEEVIPDPLLISKTILNTALSNNGEQRLLTVNGEANSEFEVVFQDTSGVISIQSYKIDITGKKDINLNFDNGSTEETYTITIKSLTGTDFSNNFGSKTITLVRPAKSRKRSTFSVSYSNTINNSFFVEDYINSSTNRTFSFDLTLPSGVYTIGKQPTVNDISFGDNDNDSAILLDDITFDAVNTNVLTVSGRLFVGNFQENEVYSLDVSKFVGVNVTTTFDYSINASDGNPSGNYTVGATSYTVSGGAGLSSTPSVNEYFFTLTPSATYSFKADIDADDFELLDSSNVDVVADYAANGEILVRKVGDNIEVGFKTKTFTQPSSSSTFTIRPKVGLTITEATSVSTVPRFILDIYTTNAIDGVRDKFNYTQRGQVLTNVDINSDVLYQYTLSARGGLFDPNEFTDTSLFYYDNTSSSYITLAAAGTYGSTTITGPFEVNDTYDRLTVNILVNLAGDSSLTYGKINLYINNTTEKTVNDSGDLIGKYYLVAVKLAGCEEQVNAPNENDREFSTLDESSNSYPRYYATSATLDNDVRIFERISSAQPIPGNIFGFTAQNLIQKNNEKLFTVSSKNTSTGFEAGWLFEKGVCNLDGSHLSLYNNTQKHKLYPDVVKYSYPIKSTIYKNTKITLTGIIKFDNISNYNSIVQELIDKGYINLKAITGAAINKTALTFEFPAYFDQNGNSTFDVQLLRGSKEYSIEFTFDDLVSNSPLKKVSLKAWDMRRYSDEDKDNNDHVTPKTDYDVYDDYNQSGELDRYDDGSGDYDGTDDRVTDNTPTVGEDGYEGDANDISTLPDYVTDGDSLVEYLNGGTAKEILSYGSWYFDGLRSKIFRSADGPVSGSHDYMHVGMRIRINQTSLQGNISQLTNYIGMWNKINDGTITSIKIPIELIDGTYNFSDKTRVPLKRFSTTTIDLNGGTAALESFVPDYEAAVGYKNYYITNDNIYICESFGDGLIAGPNYEYIEINLGVFIKQYVINTSNKHIVWIKTPFNINFAGKANPFVRGRTPRSGLNEVWRDDLIQLYGYMYNIHFSNDPNTYGGKDIGNGKAYTNLIKLRS